jgi:hypothetical protein
MGSSLEDMVGSHDAAAAGSRTPGRRFAEKERLAVEEKLAERLARDLGCLSHYWEGSGVFADGRCCLRHDL